MLQHRPDIYQGLRSDETYKGKMPMGQLEHVVTITSTYSATCLHTAQDHPLSRALSRPH
jgi:hypothetical protein